MHVYLKVKIKSLASEASDIRKEERRINIGSRARKRIRRDIQTGEARTHSGERAETLTAAQLERLTKKLRVAQWRKENEANKIRFDGLRTHRKNEVRQEARSSFIAYAFIRGKNYINTEQTDLEIDWKRVEALVTKFGEDDLRARMQNFSEWKDTALKVQKDYAARKSLS